MENKFEMWKEGSICYYSDIESIKLHLSCVEESIHNIVNKMKESKDKKNKIYLQKTINEVRAKMFLISIVLDLCDKGPDD